MQITLEDDDLWRSFSAAGTEMIITKMGRRMFPGLRISAAGLRPAEKYCLVLDIAPVDTKRYKFTDGEWKVGGRAEPQHHRRFLSIPIRRIQVHTGPLTRSAFVPLNSPTTW